MSKGGNKKALSLISRVSSFNFAIFVSDIVTVNGPYFEEFITFRSSSREHVVTYKFPNKAPTQGNWATSIQF